MRLFLYYYSRTVLPYFLINRSGQKHKHHAIDPEVCMNLSPVVLEGVVGAGLWLLWAGGHPIFIAPSEGVRWSLQAALGAEGTCVGVRDCRGCRLKLSRWVLTSGVQGGGVCPGGGAGGVDGRSTSSSSVSERRRDRVELQSDTRWKRQECEGRGQRGEGDGGFPVWRVCVWVGWRHDLNPRYGENSPSHRGRTLSSTRTSSNRFWLKPTAARAAPQPSNTSSDLRLPLGAPPRITGENVRSHSSRAALHAVTVHSGSIPVERDAEVWLARGVSWLRWEAAVLIFYREKETGGGRKISQSCTITSLHILTVTGWSFLIYAFFLFSFAANIIR